jgi:hypothetical protein
VATPEPRPPDNASLAGFVLGDATAPADLRRRAGKTLARRRWSQSPSSERSEQTRPGLDAIWQKFLDQVDPERRLPEAERERLAREARSAHMAGLALARDARRRKATDG